MITLPLSIIVPVSINIAAVAAQSPTFNIGLVIGSSGVIPAVGGNAPRIRLYNAGNWSSAMLMDGFTTASAEYIAVGIYFSQSPSPQYVYVGCQDPTAIATEALDAGHGGAGYNVGDVVSVVKAGASGGQAVVTAVNAGAVTAVALVPGQQGTGYAVANDLATTAVAGGGAGLEVNITAIGETPLQAVSACRAATANWYSCCVLGSAKADHIAIAGYAQAVTPQMVYHYVTADADALSGAAGDVFLALKTAAYSRALGIYSTTQGGLAPNNVYAAAATMGTAMGLNTGLSGSYFTMKFKQLVGIAAEPLTVTQVGVIEGNNGNLYLSYASSYNFFEQGVMPNGQFYDEVINLDLLGSNIQYAVIDEFASTKAVPQNNGGQQQIIAAVTRAAAISADIGFISPGTWTGPNILDGLTDGTPVPLGYLAQSESFTKQSPSDRAARKMMPTYLGILETGAGHFAVIGVYVQR